MESYLIYLICRFFLLFLRLLPRWAAIALIDSMAWVAYYVDSRHRHIARVNLRIAFPELSLREHDQIGRKSFQNTARNLVELSRFPMLSPGNISSLVCYDPKFGLENFLSARASGRPILYLTGHFSAWELLPAVHALYGYPLSFVTRPLDNASLERYLLKLREAFGNKVIYKKNSARPILEKLKVGEQVGILIDQNTSLEEGIFVTLFGVPAATTTSLALFALRADALVVPGFMSPMRDGRYVMKFLPAIEPIRTGDMNRDMELNTQCFNDVLERMIREQPEAWLWGHMRWKNQPEGNPADLYRLSRKELQKFVTDCRNRKRTNEQSRHSSSGTT